jgi:hypothetical protein
MHPVSKPLFTAVLVCLLLASAQAPAPCTPAGEGEGSASNTLTDAQRQAGWNLLFDGKTAQGWRGYGKDGMPEKGWVVEDGCLHVVAGGGGGDIMTVETFQDFDLKIDFKVSEKANSGIIYLVSEDEKNPWQTGPEFQILDDLGHNMDPTSGNSVGALYSLYNPPAHKIVKPAGEWNTARLVIQKGKVEHWLNDVLLVECDLKSDDWKEWVAKTKFAPFEKFGKIKKGHIDLQDHGHDVWFRNIMIRDLTPRVGSTEIPLFNGRDLSGWSHHLNDDAPMEGTWTVEDGILICKGQPAGYIYTDREYGNFILKLKWRFNPVTKQAGNSGVLLRQVGPHKVWPKSVEAQLQSGNAGDFWCIDNFPMKTDPERTSGRNTRKTHSNEHPIGEWNEYEIVVNGGDVSLIVNGEMLNLATEVEEVPGRICLQSEGAEIHFRDIRLISLD